MDHFSLDWTQVQIYANVLAICAGSHQEIWTV